MILAGREILREVRNGRIEIEPFHEELVESNSYGFHLGDTLRVYDFPVVDAYASKDSRLVEIPEEGFRLEPFRFYLGCTAERMGSNYYAAELYARLSTALAGMFIQTSAPLGHTGAVIAWTLEIMVTQPVIVYRGMLIGKICFWENHGELVRYQGRYKNSRGTIHSQISWESP